MRCSCSARERRACPRHGAAHPRRRSPSRCGTGAMRCSCRRPTACRSVTPPSHILGLLNIVMALETGAWIRLHRRFDIDLMLHHIEPDRITDRDGRRANRSGAGRPSGSWRATTCRRCATSCGARRPVTQSVAEAVTRQNGRELGDRVRAPASCRCIACNEIEGARLDTVGRPVPGVRCGSCHWRTAKPLSPGAVGRDPGAVGFGDGRLPAR